MQWGELCGALAVFVLTRSSSAKRNYLWFQLFHGYVNACLLTHGVSAFGRYGMTLLQDTNQVDPELVATLLRRLRWLWCLEIPWALSVGEQTLLWTHHVPALLFWPYAMKHRPSVVLALALAEAQTLPKIAFNIVPRLCGHTRLPKWEFWVRLCIVVCLRLPIMTTLACLSENTVVRLFGLLFGLYDLRTIRKMVQSYCRM